MAAGKGNAPIIIKKIKKGGEAGHGGAWKVAYADFVTAMMALFLMLWLLNAVTEIQKQGIADYFGPSITQPVTSVGSGGLLGGLAIGKPGALPHPSASPTVSIPIPAERTPDAPEDDLRAGQTGHDEVDAESGYEPTPSPNPDSDKGSADRDSRSSSAQKSDKKQTGGEHDTEKPYNNASDKAGTGKKPEKPLLGNGDKANDRQLVGNGDDVNDKQLSGNAAKGNDKEWAGKSQADRSIDAAAAEKIVAEREEQAFANAELQLEQAVKDNPELKKVAGNLIIDRTANGLRIQLVDQYSSTMFPLGSSDMIAPARKLMAQVAQIIAKLPNKVAITGHTDATPYLRRGNYGNWELSADRANASRRELITAGLSPERIAQVEGRADREPLVGDQPFSPLNRRISIILLREAKPENAPAAAP